MDQTDLHIETALAMFSRIYLGGIPPTITDDSAFLSFISVLTAMEALAGFRFSDVKEKGKRFKQFVLDYLPGNYGPCADALWDFRNGMVHAFTPSSFALTHHHSERHFSLSNGLIVLNAEDFYGALLMAAQKYFLELRSTPELKTLMMNRLQHPDGGSVTLGPMEVFPQDTKGNSSDEAKRL